ncbi:leucyl/phenylalanyl-tRNA--protein transferase [Nitrosospira sp. Nsp5]|uniref:Leucyl/phenylalanyl-tRNA--protein transferase n=1 Tax=Nitrosospira multiformis TaxID=1231 RepID=A0ABY0TC79_9PROT|nr:MULTISPECIES: leucyl/phenylalanyl-tRNA--protein transferase [Nitrosospira]PTR06570.1 leucyl/phenylalanyl-tRNA--protein transferase [Nitrosospira sp. Nsp5]SDQ37460.1 leucyl/phenylalanyl-tRNA--protein transferase [Nitrosospira multiformis]
MIPWLTPESHFPPLDTALLKPSGLLAAGGDLSPQRLIEAYRRGIFPWFNEGEPILWWSPDPRMVLFPGELKISRSLRKTLKKDNYEIRVDNAFSEVMQACAAPRGEQPGTWIHAEMISAYTALHEMGVAHSVEVWMRGELMGGLYGVAQGKVFFGESMFSRIPDTSKIAFVHLVKQLERWGFHMIDCQMKTTHLASLGGREISREEFGQKLKELVNYTERVEKWCFDHEPIE